MLHSGRDHLVGEAAELRLVRRRDGDLEAAVARRGAVCAFLAIEDGALALVDAPERAPDLAGSVRPDVGDPAAPALAVQRERQPVASEARRPEQQRGRAALVQSRRE
ncbi:MAG: hypothetical protein O2895_02500 [Chloroflexi bacterium]|nr:hypothetical protein [Chloroflexota bacterium]